MNIETPEVSTDLINQGFLHKLESGMHKEAEEASTAYIRQKLYEDGILRRLFEGRTVTADELDPEVDSDKPSILCEIEPDASSATFIPFKGTGDRRYFTGKRFRIPFGMVEAERLVKSKFELMTIRMSIMDWLKENQVKAIQQQEDSMLIDTCNSIVAANAAAQNITAGAALTFKEAFTLGLKALTSLRLPVGQVLMHKNTYLDSLSLKVEDIGHAPQEERFRNGVDNEASFLGHRVVTTIKDDLVKENEMFFFAPQEFFCKFYLIQDATLFMKNEASMITFHTYESPGFGIGNTKGVVKITLS